MSTFGNEEFRRFDIPMNDPRRVRRIQRVCNLNRKRQEQICLQRTPGDAMLQHDAIQKLHGDERLLATFADLVNCADVGMVEAEAARASRRKRSKACGSRATSLGRNFRATKRPSSVSSAL